jgi:hypothetical protein
MGMVYPGLGSVSATTGPRYIGWTESVTCMHSLVRYFPVSPLGGSGSIKQTAGAHLSSPNYSFLSFSFSFLRLISTLIQTHTHSLSYRLLSLSTWLLLLLLLSPPWSLCSPRAPSPSHPRALTQTVSTSSVPLAARSLARPRPPA